MDKEKSTYNLPDGWAWTTIGEVGILSSGGTPSRGNSNFFNGDIPWVKSGELNYNIITDTEEKITQEALDFSSAKIIPANSLLIALYGSTVGKIATLGIDASTNQAVAAIETFPNLNQRFLYYYLIHNREKLLQKRKGGAQPNISQKILSEFKFPFPPFNEQNVIVSKIEELFSELDHAQKGLKNATKQLYVYRQALLKSAFNGKLTESWREQNRNESVENLIKDIIRGREAHYIEEIEQWKESIKIWEENGKKHAKPIKPSKNTKEYKLSKVDLENLPKLPQNWKWVKFGNVCLKIMDGTHFSPKNFNSGDYMYLTSKNILEGRIDLNDITFISKKDHDEIYSRCDVIKGDVLYVKDGSKTGRAAVNHLDKEFSLLSSVGVFRTIKDKITPKFLEYFLNSEVTRKHMLAKAAGVAITRLTLIKLYNSFFTLCPTQEQNKIVEILESRFTLIENLEKTINKSINDIEVFKHSLLKKAFEGKLVTPSPADEPATILLQKIRLEKEAFLLAQKENSKLKHEKKKQMEAKKTVLEILKKEENPISTQELWQNSIHDGDIESFYNEIKSIYNQIDELKKDSESFLSLKK